MDNSNVGSLHALSEPDTAEVETFLDEMLLIYPVLGVQVFQKAEEQPSSSVRLYLKGKDTEAEGTETADGFVVYAESLARAAAVPSIHAHGAQLRAALADKGLLVEDGRHFRLTEDYVLASPSTAVMVMLGRAANGRTEWKTAKSQTLKNLQTLDISEA